MKTHEQLATLTAALEAEGWTRLNGNTWLKPNGQSQLRTAYTYQEATLKLSRLDGKGKSWFYRGADPLAWAAEHSGIFPKQKVRESLANLLDNLS